MQRNYKLALRVFVPNIYTLTRLLALFITILNSLNLQGQTLSYEVIKGNKTIGQMQVAKTINGDSEQYLVKSDVEIRVLFTFNITYHLEELFKSGMLISGNAYNTINGKTQKHSSVQQNPDRESYTVYVNDKEKFVSEDSIQYTIPRLYYEEPVGRDVVFSQQLSAYLPIVKKSQRIYEVDSDDGLNIYHYDQNGRCVEVKVIRPIANFSFKLVD